MSRLTQRWRGWCTGIVGGLIGLGPTLGLGETPPGGPASSPAGSPVAASPPADGAVRDFVLTADQLPFQQEVDLKLGEHVNLVLPSGEKLVVWADRYADHTITVEPASESGLIVAFGMQRGRRFLRPGDPIQPVSTVTGPNGTTYRLHSQACAIEVAGSPLSKPDLRVRLAVRAEKRVEVEDPKQRIRKQLASPEAAERARGVAAAKDQQWDGEAAEIDRLVRALAEDKDPAVRERVRQYLLARGDEETLLASVTPLPPPKDRNAKGGLALGARARAAKSAADAPQAKLCAHVVDMLKSEDPGLRAYAAAFFSEFAYPPAGEALLAATRDASAEVRKYALEAARPPVTKVTAFVPAVLRGLKDPDLAVRLQAFRLAGRLNRQISADLITPHLRDPEARVRVAAVDALDCSDDPAAVAPLLEATHDADPRVRGEAAIALGRNQATTAMDRLVEMLGDSDPEVRFAVANGLRWMRDPRGRAPLKKLLETEKDRTVREMALQALAEIPES